jgi:hypothetical protein
MERRVTGYSNLSGTLDAKQSIDNHAIANAWFDIVETFWR